MAKLVFAITTDVICRCAHAATELVQKDDGICYCQMASLVG